MTMGMNIAPFNQHGKTKSPEEEVAKAEEGEEQGLDEAPEAKMQG